MQRQQPATKTAKLLYRPWGLVASLLGGLLARQIFLWVWKTVDRDRSADPPKPLESEYRLRTIMVAALLEGAIFSAVRALINRGGARAFQRWTGEWPGN